MDELNDCHGNNKIKWENACHQNMKIADGPITYLNKKYFMMMSIEENIPIPNELICTYLKKPPNKKWYIPMQISCLLAKRNV